MNKEKNFAFHQISLICVFILGNLVISFPKGNGVAQSFFGLILCLVISLGAVYLYSGIQSFKPLCDKKGIDIFKSRGALIGVCTAFLIFMLICYAESTKDFVLLVDEVWLRDTPNFIICALFLGVSIWLALSGKKCVFCFALFSAVFIVLAVVFMLLLSLEKFDLRLLGGVFDIDAKYTVRQALGFYIHGFGQIMICLLFIGYNNRKTAAKQQILGVSAAGLIILILLVNTAALLGTGIIKNVSFPYATATSIINSQIDYTRLDAVTYYIYFITSLIKTAVIYKTALVLSESIGMKIKTGVAVIFPLTAFLFSVIKPLSEFLNGDIISTVLLVFEIAVPVFFYVVSKRKISCSHQ